MNIESLILKCTDMPRTSFDPMQTGSVDVFGNSWQTGSQECQGIVTPPNPCDVDPVAQIAAHGACNNLNNLNGSDVTLTLSVHALRSLLNVYDQRQLIS